MDGLSNSEKFTTYINLIDGKFRIKSDKTKPDVVARINKNKQEVYELCYDTLTGFITNIEKKDSDYGYQWAISISVADEKYVLNLPFSGGVTAGLMLKMENIDFNQKVTLKVYHIESDTQKGVYKTFLVPYQNSKKIESKYTKENPNGLPSLIEKKSVKGVKEWDDTDRLIFIENIINKVVLPKLSQNNQKSNSFPSSQANSEYAQLTNEIDADLPF